MARFSLFWLLLCSLAFAEHAPGETNSTDTNASGPLIIEENSGLSNEEIRKNAKNLEEPSQNLKIKDVVEAIDENGTIELKKLPKRSWEELSPTPKNGFDWIETKHGDWLKGHIRYLYDDDVEFDSPEFGVITISLGDIKRMKSYGMMRVNIDDAAIFVGLVDYKDGEITIHSGKHSYTFQKRYIISISTAKEEERYLWSGDITLDYDLRRGNTDQSNATLRVALKRRTPKNRFAFDYLGRYSKSDGAKTAEDNRINAKYDYFLNKRFFLTPVFGEYYQNYFQNIKSQVTLGSGLGYTLFDTGVSEWYISAGPAYLRTEFYEVSAGQKAHDSSASFEVLSKYEYKFKKLHKLKIEYKMTFSDKKTGRFRHHFVSKLENDIVKDKIFLDMTFLWDYVKEVQSTDGYTPLQNDYQFLVGAGIKF